MKTKETDIHTYKQTNRKTDEQRKLKEIARMVHFNIARISSFTLLHLVLSCPVSVCHVPHCPVFLQVLSLLAHFSPFPDSTFLCYLVLNCPCPVFIPVNADGGQIEDGCCAAEYVEGNPRITQRISKIPNRFIDL